MPGDIGYAEVVAADGSDIIEAKNQSDCSAMSPRCHGSLTEARHLLGIFNHMAEERFRVAPGCRRA